MKHANWCERTKGCGPCNCGLLPGLPAPDIKPEPARELSKTCTFRACEWLRAVADMLEVKGRLYGNSIDNPVRIFNKNGSKRDGLAARVDDKLARIRAAAPDDSEDSYKDLVGYIALWVGCEEDES